MDSSLFSQIASSQSGLQSASRQASGVFDIEKRAQSIAKKGQKQLQDVATDQLNGLIGQSAVEVGALGLHLGYRGVKAYEHYTRTINPIIETIKQTKAITGITDTEVKPKPVFKTQSLGDSEPTSDKLPAEILSNDTVPYRPARFAGRSSTLDPLTEESVLQRADEVNAYVDSVLKAHGGRPYIPPTSGRDDFIESGLNDYIKAGRRIGDFGEGSAPASDDLDRVRGQLGAVYDMRQTKGSGLPGGKPLGDEAFGQGLSAPDRGGIYSVRGGIRELDTASLRASREAEPEFEQEFGQQTRTLVPRTIPVDSVSQYGDRPTEGGLEDAQSVREARFDQIDKTSALATTQDAVSRAAQPTRGTEFGEGIEDSPSEISGSGQDKEFDDDYLPEDEETRLANKAASENIGKVAGDTITEGVEGVSKLGSELTSGIGLGDGLAAVNIGQTLLSKGSSAVQKVSSLAEQGGILAATEGAESLIPGAGEVLMGLTAIGGLVSDLFEKHKEESSKPSQPPPPTQPGIAFQSSSALDSSQYRGYIGN